jgi:hypothetical protein
VGSSDVKAAMPELEARSHETWNVGSSAQCGKNRENIKLVCSSADKIRRMRESQPAAEGAGGRLFASNRLGLAIHPAHPVVVILRTFMPQRNANGTETGTYRLFRSETQKSR